jgi:hypothetical protein
VPVGETPFEIAAVSVTGARTVGFAGEDDTASVGAAWPTVTVFTGDVLPALFVSPAYDAVIEWLPTLSVEVVKLAVVPETVPVPSEVPPSEKVTVPVGETPFEIAAVSVTDAPNMGVAGEDDTASVGAAWPTVTVCTGDVLPVLSASPP